MMDINVNWSQWFISFFLKKEFALLPDKSAFGSGIKNENVSNKELAKELHKPIIRIFQKRKAHSYFIDNICVPILLIYN